MRNWIIANYIVSLVCFGSISLYVLKIFVVFFVCVYVRVVQKKLFFLNFFSQLLKRWHYWRIIPVQNLGLIDAWEPLPQEASNLPMVCNGRNGWTSKNQHFEKSFKARETISTSQTGCYISVKIAKIWHLDSLSSWRTVGRSL